MTSFDDIPLFYLLLPVVAFLYAAVGHGGASGYLALMILFSFAPPEMKSTALILNICVSVVAFLGYATKGHFNLRTYLLVGLIAIPAAFLGGSIDADTPLFKKFLGVFLLFAVLRLLGLFDRTEHPGTQSPNPFTALSMGAGVGFLSGMLGIGGGILLTPLLVLFRWATLKEAAGISALFILVNSIAGLSGMLYTSRLVVNENIAVMAGCAIAGGILGSYMGSRRLNAKAIRYLLVVVLLVAGYKLFFS